MTRMTAMLLSATAVLFSISVAAFGTSSDEQMILDLERQVSAASAGNDIPALDKLVADDYIGIEAIGNTETKAQWFDGIRSKALIAMSEVPSQLKVRLYGDVAVVTGHLSIRDIRNGKPGHHEVMFTDIWVKRGGRWQYIQYQGTMLPQQEAAAAPENVPPRIAPAGEFTSIRAADARWTRDPPSDVEIAPLWGKPLSGEAGGELYRFEPNYASPEHTHPFHERAMVIRGAFVVLRPGQAPHPLGPGDYFFVPANSVHATRCEGAEPCELYNEVVPSRD